MYKLLVFTVLGVCVGNKLPSNFKKCDRKQSDFDKCFHSSVENALRQLDKPFKELGLPSFHPLVIPVLSIGAGTGAAGFQQNYKEMKIYGFITPNCSEIKLDFENKQMRWACFVEEIKTEFEYDFNGKILLFSFNGHGPGVVSLYKLNTTIAFDFEEYEKNNEKHWRIKNSKYTMIPESMSFKLDNLLGTGEDETFSKTLNKIFNDNWPALFEDVGPSYEDAFGQIFGSIFNQMLSKVSLKEMFGEE